MDLYYSKSRAILFAEIVYTPHANWKFTKHWTEIMNFNNYKCFMFTIHKFGHAEVVVCIILNLKEFHFCKIAVGLHYAEIFKISR